MKINMTKISTVVFTSLALISCGGSGNDSKTTSTTLFGGKLAEDYRDATAATTNALNGTVPGSPIALEGDDDNDDVAPAPPSIGADVPVTYFGPAPSSVNPKLIGPLLLLKAGRVDLNAVPSTTVTLPLYEGKLVSGGPSDGKTFWYITTDTSDEANAAALGLNFSSKLNFSSLPDASTRTFMSTSVRHGIYNSDGLLLVDGGTVDFSPVRKVSSPTTDASGTTNLLSTLAFNPGAIGSDNSDADGFYSPLVQIENAGNHIYNAPMISFGTSRNQLSSYCDGITSAQETQARSILHDKVVAICPGETASEPGTVTLELTQGFSFGRPVLYLSTDTSVNIAAALEGAIFAPAMTNIPVGKDDSLFSPVERIFGFTNGSVNDFDESSPQRQGFNSAIRGEGGPLNVLGGIPTVATDYSPLWDLNLGEWTQEAIDNGYRSRMTEEFSILGMVQRGYLTGPGGSPFGSTGIIINCPIVQRLL